MNANLQKTQQRAIQYWFVDGWSELFGGLICLLLAGLFYFKEAMPPSTWTDLLFYLGAFGGAFVLRGVMQRIKERTTYPRTGYVGYKSSREDKRPLAIFGPGGLYGMAILSGLAGLVLLAFGGWVRWAYLRQYPRPLDENRGR